MALAELAAPDTATTQPGAKDDTGAGVLQDPLKFLADFSDNPAPEAAPAAQAEGQPDNSETKNNEPDLSQPEPNAAAPDSEPGADPREQNEDPAPPKEPEWFQKRIDKEVGRRKALEEKLQATEQRLKELETGREAPRASAADDPAEASPEVQAVNAEYGKAKANLDRARELLDDIEDKPEAVLATLVKAKLLDETAGEREARRFLRQQERQWQDKLTEQSAELTARREQARARQQTLRTQSQQAALQHFPWLKQPDGPEYEATVRVFEEFPELKRNPRGILLACAAGEKLAAVERQRPGQGGAADRPKTPPKLAGATPGATRGGARTDSGMAAVDRAVKTGSTEAAQDFLARY